MQEIIPENKLMVLTESVLKVIAVPSNRMRLALYMGYTDRGIHALIQRNDPKLTQYSPLQVIKKIAKENGIKESEILTEKKD